MSESQRTDFEANFPTYVQSVRERLSGLVAERLEQLGVADCLIGGKSRLQLFFRGSASSYLSRKLDCEVIKTDVRGGLTQSE